MSDKGISPELEAVLRKMREANGDEFKLCPRCRCCELIPNLEDDSCWNCAGEGYHDLYEEDPLWYDEDEIEICSECQGSGTLGSYYPCSCDEKGNHEWTRHASLSPRFTRTEKGSERRAKG